MTNPIVAIATDPFTPTPLGQAPLSQAPLSADTTLETAGDADLRAAVSSVDDLLRVTPGRLSRLRVQSGAASIELEWQLAPTVGAGPGPAAGAVATSVPGPDAVDAEAEPTEGCPPAGHHVRSPLVGTFYRSPEPGAAPFVEEGASVAEGDVIGIVEAMKLMNNIVAPIPGRVVHLAAPDGGSVQYDQLLVVIVPETDGE